MKTIDAALAGGQTVATAAYYVTKGLAVTRHLDRPGWQVTHVASGCTLDNGFRLRQQARAYQQVLLALNVDWTQGKAQVLRATKNGTTLRAILRSL